MSPDDTLRCYKAKQSEIEQEQELNIMYNFIIFNPKANGSRNDSCKLMLIVYNGE